MKKLYPLNDVDGVCVKCTYIEERSGPAKLEDTRLTLVHPFYNEQIRFEKQVETWRGWSDYVKDKVNIVLIDDGSPNPVHEYITPEIKTLLKDFIFSIYRIDKDLKWNTPGALNLGLTVAPTDWVLIMDSDCSLDNENMERLLKADPEDGCIYKFPRKQVGKEDEDLTNRRYLTCAILFHRSIFFDVLNGFDEDFTGEYSGGYAYFDNDFDDRVRLASVPIFIWNDVTITYWMPSICGIVERTKEDERVNRRLYYEKQALRRISLQPLNQTEKLRFNYVRSYYNERGS